MNAGFGKRQIQRTALGLIAFVVMSTRIAAQTGLPMQPVVDELSLMTTPIFLMNGGKQVSIGTGFFFARTDANGKPDLVFLATNYHVFTGYAPGEKGPRKGDVVRFFLHRDPQKPDQVKQVDYPLFTRSGEPAWLTSSAAPDADVALLPLPHGVFEGANVIVFAEKDTVSEMRIAPMSAVTLVGYPYGYFDTKNFLPIWKTGTIASEPGFDFDGKRLFVVDVSAFPGMSGSPVMAIGNGSYTSKTGGVVIGNGRQLLGIFASTQMMNEKKFIEELAMDQGRRLGVVVSTSLDLGHVWKADILVDIVKHFDVKAYEARISQAK